jgi:hypothetical protein
MNLLQVGVGVIINARQAMEDMEETKSFSDDSSFYGGQVGLDL